MTDTSVTFTNDELNEAAFQEQHELDSAQLKHLTNRVASLRALVNRLTLENSSLRKMLEELQQNSTNDEVHDVTTLDK